MVARDAMSHQSSVGLSVIRDATPPTLTLAALLHGTDVHVTWSSDDSGSGVDASTCLLKVREDEGTWQTFSTECVGDDTYEGEPGHTYAFRLTASDNVANEDSLEVEAVVPYVKKYYYANGQRVAMRQGDVVYYIHADHLGSTSLLSDQSGNQVPGSAVRYLPYGGLRLGDASTLPTDYGFTGQRLEAGIGLMHYGARFYSPRLGRFVSADTIVPKPGDPQALNRYAYAANSPLSFIDPNGHQVRPQESCDFICYTGTLGPYNAQIASPAAQPLTTASYQSSHDVYYITAAPRGSELGSATPTPSFDAGLFAAEVYLAGINLLTAGGAMVAPPAGAGPYMHAPPGQVGLATGPKPAPYEPPLLPAPPAPAGLLPGEGRENPWSAASVSFVLEEEVTLWRTWGGDAGETGGFMSLTRPPDRATAKSTWALPDNNTAEFVTGFRIPAGTRVQVGWAKDNFAQLGGALQIQVLDRVQSSWIVVPKEELK